MKLMFVLLAVCLLVWEAHARTAKEEATEAYHSIPENGRIPSPPPSRETGYFLQYQLTKRLETHDLTRPGRYMDQVAVSEPLRNKYEEMAVSDAATEVLYQWVKEENKLTDEQMVGLTLRGWMCWPGDRECGSLHNPGANCCM